jgi:hypothetical protein
MRYDLVIMNCELKRIRRGHQILELFNDIIHLRSLYSSKRNDRVMMNGMCVYRHVT